MTPVKTVTL